MVDILWPGMLLQFLHLRILYLSHRARLLAYGILRSQVFFGLLMVAKDIYSANNALVPFDVC